MRMPQPRRRTTFAMFLPSAARFKLIGWEMRILDSSVDSSLTRAAVFLASIESSSASAFKRERLSFKGSVPEIFPLKFGPFTTTPHLCSVAYLKREGALILDKGHNTKTFELKPLSLSISYISLEDIH